MKTLILYGSKYGSTKDAAIQVSKQLDKIVDVMDIKDESINLHMYQNIILGSSVYVGQINKKLKKYIKENASELIQKQISIFLCRGQQDDQFEEILKQNIPEIYDYLKYKGDFGGEFRRSHMGFMEKKVIGMIMKKTDNKEPVISQEAIKVFVDALNKDYEN